MMRKIMAAIAFTLLLIVSTSAILNNTEAQENYFVLMLVCGGTYDSRDLHVHQANSESEAKAWADTEMQGAWDIAYIYDNWNTNGSTQLLWVRSESTCYPDMREWTAID